MIIDEFSNLAEKDFKSDGSYNRYPVRFYSLEFNEKTENNIIEMCKYIQKESPLHNCDIVDLQEWLNHDDAWLSIDIILKRIKSLDCELNYIIIGLSEYIRFLSNSEFITLVKSLLEIENPPNNQKRRIFFICFALYQEIIKIVNSHHPRINVYNPILNEMVYDKLQQVYFIKEGLYNIINENVIINTKQWFNMWRESSFSYSKPIICVSRTLYEFYYKACPDNVYNITLISTYEELLSKLYNINNIVPLKNNEIDFYNYLLKIISNKENKLIQQLILNDLNTLEISDENVIYIWRINDRYKRCLIKNYILLYFDRGTYLYTIMNEIEDCSEDEFFKLIYTSIFKNYNMKLAKERKILINKIIEMNNSIDYSDHIIKFYYKYLLAIINQYIKIDENFKIDLNNGNTIASDDSSKIVKLNEEIQEKLIPIITSSSKCERTIIIWLYINKLIDINDISGIYPELYAYVNEQSIDLLPLQDNKLHLYFNKYKKCRLNQIESAEYIIELDKWNNSEESFYKWYLDNNLSFPEQIIKRNSIEDNIIVFDGVGGEFLGYIIYLLNYYRYNIETCLYAKSHIPSTTGQAKKYFPERYKWYRQFDKDVIHGEMYYHISNIEQSLRVIKEMVINVINEYSGKNIAIVSDHGSTVNHKIINTLKCYDFSNADHGGRCLKVLDNINNYKKSKDYIKYEDEFNDNWIISINEKSLNNSSPYAVHGGGTIEEVIVPVIIAHPSERKTLSVLSYSILPEKLLVSGIDKEVSFTIIPKPELSPTIKSTDGTDKHLTYDIEDNYWKVDLNTGKKQTIFIEIDKQKFKFETNIRNIMKGNDGFDD